MKEPLSAGLFPSLPNVAFALRKLIAAWISYESFSPPRFFVSESTPRVCSGSIRPPSLSPRVPRRDFGLGVQCGLGVPGL